MGVPKMAIDESRLRMIIADLKSFGLALSDVEREVTLRNKWGKRQNADMTQYTTEELTEAAERWLRL